MKNYFVFFVFVMPVLLHLCSNNSVYKKKEGLFSQKLVNLNEDTLYLNEIVKEKSLIFRYSILSCNSCVDSVFYYIRENEEILGDLKILVFTYFNDLRHFIVTARLNRISYDIFLIPDNKLDMPQDNPLIPFFFLVDENCNISNFYYINNVDKQKKQIKEYFESIKKNDI
ncbi:MAG: hypothetical protein WCY58_12015 [Mariniphaga sp.]|nr:hypothetical protein [Mariniphaga sp.]MDD4227071.1 hypothetical protein [Mariniphaga sp.]